MLVFEHVRYEILRDPVVRDFSLTLAAGEAKTLFGPSGCGKTTVLRLAAGLEKPKSGSLKNSFAKTGFMFQENRLLNHLTALKNILIFMEHPNPAAVIALAGEIGLEKGDLHKYPAELSGGMAKRVAFLRLLLCGCDLALLDEPFVGLDRDLRAALAAMLAERIAQGLACLLVTHDRFEAARLSHQILLLSRKGMAVERTVNLPEPVVGRGDAYESRVVAQEFGGVVYYD